MDILDNTISIESEYIETFTISDQTRKLTHKEKVQKVKELFTREYQGKSVRYDKEGKSIWVKTNKDTRKNFPWKKEKTWQKAHATKIDIVANNDYFKLISNVHYISSSEETKKDQSKLHKNTLRWHYFVKPIICDMVRYNVLIDVREDIHHRFSIHDISLRYPSKQKEKEFVLPD